MRKFFALAIILPLLMTGCWKEEEAPGTSTPNTGKKNPSAEELTETSFDEFMKKNQKAWSDAFFSVIGEMDDYKKVKENLDIDAVAYIEDVGGELDLSLSTESLTNMEDPEDPQLKSTISFNGDVNGQGGPGGADITGSARAVLEFIVAEQSVFVSLQELNVSAPNIPVDQFLAPLQPNIGKWFGNTFEEINQLTSGKMNLEEAFFQNAKLYGKLYEIQSKGLDINIFTEKKKLSTEDGFARFEVEITEEGREKLENAVSEMITLVEGGADVLPERIETDVKEGIQKLKGKGTVGFFLEDPKYFTFEGTFSGADEEEAVMVSLSILKEKKVVSITGADEEYVALEVVEGERERNVRLYGGKTKDESLDIIVGKRTNSSLELMFFNPQSEGENVAKISLEKEGNVWAGSVTNTFNPEIVVNINRLEVTIGNIALDLEVKNGDKVLVSGELKYSLEKLEKVGIRVPDSFSSFKELMNSFAPAGSSPSPVAPVSPGVPVPLPPASEPPFASPGGVNLDEVIEDEALVEEEPEEIIGDGEPEEMPLI
jgi:hypothetical protein